MADAYERVMGELDRRMSRRELFRRAGQGSLALGAAWLLAACGVRGAGRPQQKLEPLPPKAGELTMANWPLYIDKSHGKYPTVETFSKREGVDMKYEEVIGDNDDFFGTIREPLAQGEATGWDIIVLSDWVVAKMSRLGYLERLHRDRLPNVEANQAQRLRGLYYDPNNDYSVPWAAGITGIGYDRKLTGRDLTSVDDLFDPAFKGRVGMFLEMRDTIPLVLLSMGVDPEKATIPQVETAQKRLLQQRDDGIVRGYFDNSYADKLATGDLIVSMAWSGDVFALQQDNPNLQFIIPEEGGMRWVDNMMIPAGAAHPTDAHLFMNFVYEPRIAANITEWVWYESPVEPALDVIEQDAEGGPKYLQELASSPLVWPNEQILAQTHPYPVLDEEEERIWNDLFQELTQGG